MVADAYHFAMEFPISALLPQLLASLDAHPRLVLEAPPGAGKTTQVPLALLSAGWRGDGRILVLEPRRVAARAAAGFMARQLGEPVGETVGYRIRFESKVSARTRSRCSPRHPHALLQDDPISRRGGDRVRRIPRAPPGRRPRPALALDVQAQLRPELRLLLMSATLDGASWRVARCAAPEFGRAQLPRGGRAFPAARRGERAGAAAALRGGALGAAEGDVLRLPARSARDRRRRACAARATGRRGERRARAASACE
jgi:ATP-dependent helicase HrpB